jgi:hypothetical protein
MPLPDGFQIKVFCTTDPHIWKHKIHFPIIHRQTTHYERVQDRDHVLRLAWNQKVMLVNRLLWMEKKAQGRCKRTWGILQHGVCPESVQVFSLMEIDSALRVTK